MFLLVAFIARKKSPLIALLSLLFMVPDKPTIAANPGAIDLAFAVD